MQDEAPKQPHILREWQDHLSDSSGVEKHPWEYAIRCNPDCDWLSYKSEGLPYLERYWTCHIYWKFCGCLLALCLCFHCNRIIPSSNPRASAYIWERRAKPLTMRVLLRGSLVLKVSWCSDLFYVEVEYYIRVSCNIVSVHAFPKFKIYIYSSNRYWRGPFWIYSSFSICFCYKNWIMRSQIWYCI